MPACRTKSVVIGTRRNPQGRGRYQRIGGAGPPLPKPRLSRNREERKDDCSEQSDHRKDGNRRSRLGPSRSRQNNWSTNRDGESYKRDAWHYEVEQRAIADLVKFDYAPSVIQREQSPSEGRDGDQNFCALAHVRGPFPRRSHTARRPTLNYSTSLFEQRNRQRRNCGCG